MVFFTTNPNLRLKILFLGGDGEVDGELVCGGGWSK